MNAYDKLRELLYNDSFDLQVGPRINGIQTGTFNTNVVVGAVDNQQFTSPFSIPTLGAGDGVLIEWFTFAFQPPLPSTVILSALASLLSGLTRPLLYTARETLNGQGNLGGSQMGFVFGPPVLLTSFDIQRLLGGSGPLPVSRQPIKFSVAFSDTDSNAQVVPFTWSVLYRLVKGLQEN